MASNPLPHHSSILIIGAGIFGTSTAYHLSLTHPSTSITVIDRTVTPPSPAASTDINKIIRADYTSPFYMDLAYEAMHAWSTLPELKPYYHRTGWVMLDEKGSDLAEQIRKNFRARSGHGADPTSDVALEMVRERWGGVLKEVDVEGYESAYSNPDSGWCDAGAAVAEMMKTAMTRGVKYVVGDVTELVLGRKCVDGVRTSEGKTFYADKILLCTGAWTSKLVSPLEDVLEIKEEDRIERQIKAAGVCVAHYKMTAEEMRELKEMPVVVYGGNGEVLPPPKNNLLKFTNANTFTNHIRTSSGHRISVPPERDQHIVPDKLKQETTDIIISKTMPQYTRQQPEYWRLCWDSVTPTQDQLITKHPHPRLSNVYLAVGGSFHSYKFLPIIGKYVVNVSNGKSNGDEKDKAWRWKTGKETGRGAHEKVIPQRELAGLEDDRSPITRSGKARL